MAVHGNQWQSSPPAISSTVLYIHAVKSGDWFSSCESACGTIRRPLDDRMHDDINSTSKDVRKYCVHSSPSGLLRMGRLDMGIIGDCVTAYSDGPRSSCFTLLCVAEGLACMLISTLATFQREKLKASYCCTCVLHQSHLLEHVDDKHRRHWQTITKSISFSRMIQHRDTAIPMATHRQRGSSSTVHRTVALGQHFATRPDGCLK